MEDPRIISALFIFLKMAYYNVLINNMLINTKKAMKGVFILSHGALRKENQFLRREHTDHKETQRNETTGTGGQNRYQYAEPF